ncbi:MAG TPA: peptidoglycan DD-metalloendopeptidase family protein [Hymenobacter sp.]|uniref:murein hydrolase activator EnvC family protein n=1 Tax=Hymenobacter sp. TaxID=1898978 RepID=UPI002D8091F7|nr:peptidoglycan DD-metalloendopeptidase family protein [Hymenobacter sp.]HET9503428.1 peptidoglycan DD-metalloendopeptidase family protein [Hymenobacter sp.]
MKFLFVLVYRRATLLGFAGLLLLLALPVAAQRHPRSPAGKAKAKASATKAKAKPAARPGSAGRARPAARRSAPVARAPRAAGRGKSKEQLERERQANLARIAEAGKVLTETTQKKQATLGQLNIIKEKLTVKQGQIQHISTQLQGIETNVHHTTRQVLTTQEQLARLKAEYARLMYTASKTSSGFNQLMFLFAAESFNQFVLRLRYVRQYTDERHRQAQRIVGAQRQLSQQLDGLTQQRTRQKSLLTTQLVESRNLLGLKTEQDQVVQQLSQQEQGLRDELAQRQRAVAQLEGLIAQRVREEIARAARAARLAAAAERRRATAAARAGRPSPRAADDRNDASANPDRDSPEETSADRRASRVALTPQTALLSSNFAGNKGRLPWPVARGFVSQHFGRHNHPVLKHVVVENRGVDIQTNNGEAVRAVFAGRVLTVAQVPGMNTIVMIQHGEYFTVYARLRSVSVHEGQLVDARQAIGTAATDADGTAQVQFQVWRNSANLNPEGWLGRKR